VIGLRLLATKMIDPYGDDYEDLSVMMYVEATLEICDTIMNSKRAGTKMDTLPAVPKRQDWAKEVAPSEIAAKASPIPCEHASSVFWNEMSDEILIKFHLYQIIRIYWLDMI